MTQTSEQLMPLPALPPGGTTGNQIQSNPNRNSFLQGASLDFKLATLRNEMVSRYFLSQLHTKVILRLVSRFLGSNQMPFIPWKHAKRSSHRKKIFRMIS